MPSQQALAEIQAIVAKYNAMHKNLDDQTNDKQTQIQAIEAAKPPPLPAADLDKIDKLNEAIAELSELDNKISIESIEALDNSDAAKSMAADIKRVSASLKTKLERVAKTARQVQEVADFIKTLDGIAQNLIKLAPLLILRRAIPPPRGRS